MADETTLHWGDAPVVRIGDTVRRKVGPWTPAVHALLQHLESVGFEGAPRVLGVDENGREVLTYMEGTDGRQGRPYDDRTLVEEARLLRRYHDAVADFQVPAGATWRPGPWQYIADSGATAPTTICHNDLAPYNLLYVAEVPRSIIDWDMSGPAPVVWDVVYAAWRFVPLYPDDVCVQLGYPVEPKGRRLRVFCDAYGLTDREGLLSSLRSRLACENSDFAGRSLRYIDQNWADWAVALT